MTRRSAPEPLHERDRDGLDDLEELGDDAIISQETAAHAPRPRAKVAEEARSVVIRDPPRAHAERAQAQGRRSSAEATLVIRDRRALAELRAAISGGRSKKVNARRALYRWGALGIIAFALGGVAAFLATDTRSEPELSDAHDSAPHLTPTASAALAPVRDEPHGRGKATAFEPGHTVRLDDLPLESAESAEREPKK